ncbi:MAG: hypothetical protein M1343_05550 [Chloroflexi bacterium]|nr:hypothetical protein [Chloroflexota bacterium]
MSFEIAQITVRKGKAHIPTFGVMPSGNSINVEPVHVVDLDAEQVVEAFEKNRAHGNPRLPSLEQRELCGSHSAREELPRAVGTTGKPAH